MRKFAFLLILVVCSIYTQAQDGMGINNATPHPSAILDIESTDQGVLIPRMTCEQRDSIPSPANGLLVFITDTCTDSLGNM